MYKPKITKTQSYLLLLISIIFLIGAWFRFKGLGKWPFALDEYYIIKSVQNILINGFPQFDFGGYYNRGILYQYMIALLMLTGIKAEFASRLIPVILNLLAIPALFKITKKISNSSIAFVAIVFFTFSLWEIEFSRFARMYSFFQTIFIWYLYFLFKYLFDKDNRSLKWMFGLSIISIFIYEASIFIAMLNFIIFIWDRKEKNFKFNLNFLKELRYQFIFSLLILIFTIGFTLFDFRTLNSTNLLPPELLTYFNEISKASKFRKPFILLYSSTFSISGILFTITMIVITLIGFVKIYKTENTDLLTKISLATIIILSIHNLYSIMFVLSLIFLLLDWIKINESSKKYLKIFGALILVEFIVQNLFAIVNPSWKLLVHYKVGAGLINSLKILWKEFLNYPNFYELFTLFRIIYFKYTISSILILSIGTTILIFKKGNKYFPPKLFFALFFVLLLVVTFINTKFFETRYFFFLFPMFIICVLFSLNEILNQLLRNENIRKITFVFLSLAFFFISGDFNANHLLNIDTAKINFRTEMNKNLRNHFYPRWDSRAVSDIINKISQKNDIIISNEQISSYYLKRLDYLYRYYTSDDFVLESVNSGKNERWTNAKLIYQYDDLVKILSDSDNPKWLIINKTWGIKLLEEQGLFKLVDKYTFYKDQDSTTFLYKIPKNVNF